jgi:hypothetical protein
VDPDAYCREIEAHLCRRNSGHLVRVAGPGFEMVAGWAAKGIPLKVALSGIDRAVARRDAKGPSRRPLRVEFCEADVLEAFDQWRRAVGVGTAGGGAAAGSGPAEPDEGDSRQKSGPSLRAHLDRVVTRLTDRIAGGAMPADLERAIEKTVGELGEARAASRSLRGEARAALVGRLQVLDDELMASARAVTPGDVLDALALEAGRDLAAFRGRMADADYMRALEAATNKRLRERLKLPEIGYGL